MILEKTKRQIEILACAELQGRDYSVSDLCGEYGVESITVHRDLRELRGDGFMVHSTKRRVKLLQPLTVDDYCKLISIYLSLSHRAVGYPKNVSLSVKKLQSKSLQTFIRLVNAIEDHREIEIEYLKLADNTIIRRRLQPYQLFPTIRDWRLVAKSDGIFKQFIVDNITAIKKLDHRFSPDKTFSLQNMFVHAWEIYRGKEPIVVKLLFSKKMSLIIMKRAWSENQTLEKLPNGEVYLTVRVGDIEEMVGWVMSWGNEVRVVEPVELRKRVRKLATDILKEDHNSMTGKVDFNRKHVNQTF